MVKKHFINLHKTIVQKGLCTRCGTCVGICPQRAIEFNFNLEEPFLNGHCIPCGICYGTCPGKEIPLPKLERRFLGKPRDQKNELLGVSRGFLKGYARDPEIRQRSASGGLTTALLLFALDRGLIDAAIVTSMDSQKPWRIKPALARTREQLIEASKSKYCLSPNNIMLRDTEGIERLGVVGLPCHIHGLRKAQSHKALALLTRKIVFLLGIFCGSNWSYQATEHMIHEYSDVPLEEIERFEYRGGEHAQDVKIFTREQKEITIAMAERRMVFQCMEVDRCHMCCDWSAEIADLSLGDIFDPRLRGNMRKVPNWNSLIVRSEKGQRLIEDAQKAGAIEISSIEEESFYGNIGFEIKKHGAVNHLRERRRYGWPTPNYHYEFTWQPKRKRIYPIPED